MDDFRAINGYLRIGDWVMATEDTDYRYLIGTVTAIDKYGTVKHETDNDSDDVHVDFFAYDYPEECISEIEKRFNHFDDDLMHYDDLALDDVIMAPDMLICITHILNKKQLYPNSLHFTYITLVNELESVKNKL